MVVRLPGNKIVIVDSKAVMASYLEAVNTDNETIKASKLEEHVRHIKARVDDLKKKEYWQQFDTSPELVVLFLPGESFFSAALKVDPSLIEQSIEQKVLIATPVTLIALLKAIAYGWKQESLEANAKEISDLGKELYDRLATLSEHFCDLGSSLQGSVEKYNKAVGTLENRVLVSARRFKELKVNNPNKEIQEIDPVEITVRGIQAEELK
jgi:DNA recombination protein RmuC